MDTTPICPSCGRPLAANAPQGLCPECLMKGAFPTGTDTGGRPARFVPPTIEELAAKFPQLEILELIGQGGMGAVYKARQKQLDRVVALKLLPPQTGGDPGFADRFTREAKALAKLNHPHIVTLYEFGQADGWFYFLMEYVDGINLQQLLKASRLAPKEALAIVPQICEALQYAHERGIVHRDIKPDNILLSKEGAVKIADFGVAKIMEQNPPEVPAGTAPPTGDLTAAGSTLGTPQYMAPEQLKNSAEVDHRADIYSLGVVFYQMLTGELPAGKIEPPSKKVQIDVRLDEVVLRALEKKPELRYQQASAMRTQVETIAQTSAAGAPADAAAFAQAALARDYSLNINHCLNRAWTLVTGDFWAVVGVGALIWLLSSLATSSLVGIIVRYPLEGGWWLYFLHRIRGQKTTAETAFSGFSVAFLQLVLAGVVAKLLIILGFICLLIPGIYLWVSWTFAVPLVADRQLDFWTAMGLSRKMIGRHWWKFFWFLIVLALIHLAGLMLCWVGVFVAMPLCLAALAYAYEDMFGPGGGAAGPAAAPSRQEGGGAKGLIIAVAVAAVILLAALAALVGGLVYLSHDNFLRAREQAKLRQQAEIQRHVQAERKAQEAARANRLLPAAPKSDVIGQSYFPGGDAITIVSVERDENRLVVHGHYHLVSTDQALLTLATATNGAVLPADAQQQKMIAKGEEDFTLTDAHPVPGLPQVSIKNMMRKDLGVVYFGTADEAALESKLMLSRPAVVSVSPADGATNVDLIQELRIRFDQPMDPDNLEIRWSAGGFMPTGQPRYDARRNEFIVPVTLLPGQTNDVVFNQMDGGFCSTNGRFANEYHWRFNTRPAAPHPDAPAPKVVQITPAAGETLPMLTLFEITFDQPMTPPDQRLPYLAQKGWSMELPSLIHCLGYDAAARRFTVPLALPPDNETKLVLDGFYSAEGVASEPVVLHCNIGTNILSEQQMQVGAASATDPRLGQLLTAMKTAREHYHSGMETVEWLSYSPSYPKREAFGGITAHTARFAWQGTNQACADITAAMGMGLKAFILGCDGTNCWLYGDDEQNGCRLDRAPQAQSDIDLSLADPFELASRTVQSLLDKKRMVYEGHAQLNGHDCERVQIWKVSQPKADYDRVDAERLEWWIDDATFLPVRLEQFSLYGGEAIFDFQYDQLNQPLPITVFEPPVAPGATPISDDWFTKKMDADETRFLRIYDGADGRMSGRIGRKGPRGSTNSGMN